MAVFGMVCECNPFHAGHRKLMEKAREMGADSIVAVMSGDFVQRGEPAAVSKFLRAADLAENGCSLVLELPVRFALSSAQEFAQAAVELLAATGTVDGLVFGSECGDMDRILEAARLLEDPRTLEEIDLLSREGLSWPAARERYFTGIGREDVASLLNGPNNILAVEYVRASGRLSLPFSFLTVPREADGLTAHGAREMLEKGEDAGGLVTERTLEAVRDGRTPDREAYGRVSLYRLRCMTPGDFSLLGDVTGGLGNRLYAASKTAASLEELLDGVKTKRYTMSRVKRVAARAVLSIDGARTAPAYLRILAIGPGGKEILSRMKEKALLPVTHTLRFSAEETAEMRRQAAEEVRATDLWNLITREPSPCFEDYTRKLFVHDLYV